MDPISFGIGLIGEVRQQINSVKIRIANYQGGQSMFKSLSDKLDLLVKHILEVDRLLHAVPSAVPTATSTEFNAILVEVCDNIKSASWTIPQSLLKPFSDDSSRRIGYGKLKVHQFTRAKALNAEMSSLGTKIEKASNTLLHLSSILANALTSKELEKNMVSEIYKQRTEVQENHDALLSKLDNFPETAREVYRAATSTPAPSHSVMLDFDSVDKNGIPATPEGKLKHSVMDGESSESVTAAAGIIKPAYGIVGMAGVGKSVALQGLGYDEEVKKRFDGGVHYMTFGRGATLQTAIREIAKIMTLTGATTKVENVRSSTCLRDAVDYAVMWFEGKTCLYLLDDLWPAENLPPGYFQDLRQLLRGSPDSRMAISTRSVAIASEAGCIVDFGPRDPLGAVSVDIFMTRATGRSTPRALPTAVRELRPSVSKILSICDGLPIALSVTGCAVALLSSLYGDFQGACDEYAENLEKKRIWLGEEDTMEGTSLNAGILLSLEYLESEFLKWQAKRSVRVEQCISALYTSLCVLENQAWVSVCVLRRLWRLNEEAVKAVVNLLCGMSLATLHMRRPSIESSGEQGIMLHDLQLEFCQRRAIEMEQSSLWHAQLLNGYAEAASHSRDEELSSEGMQTFLSFEPRPWWSKAIPEDGYIHANLSRHLKCAGRGTELAALLLDARWTELRGRIGGVPALKTDFELLETFFLQLDSTGNQELLDLDVRGSLSQIFSVIFEHLARFFSYSRSTGGQGTLAGEVRSLEGQPTTDVGGSFKQIFKAVQLAWGRVVRGSRVFQFQVCGHLVSLRKTNTIVDAYVKSVEKCTSKPYLLPVSSFIPGLDSALIMEIPVGGECNFVACSPCGRYIAAGAGAGVVVAKTSNGEILEHLWGHAKNVLCIAFVAGSQRIVSGAGDGKVIIWEWEFSECPVQVLEGHRNKITSVVVSSNGGRIYSSSDDKTLRVWDTTTGKQNELMQSGQLSCIAVHDEEQRIALGLRDGTLKLLDSATKDVLFEDSQAHQSKVHCVSFSPDGSYLATGSRDKTIRVWNTRTRTRVGDCFYGHNGAVKCISFSPDGNRIASSSDDGTIRLWDVESGNCIGASPKIVSEMRSVSFTSDGERIVSGADDGSVRIWDARLHAESTRQIRGHSRPVYGVAISENGQRVASASLDGTVRLWDAQTGQQIGEPIEGHSRGVFSASFSPDGRTVVIGSYDNTLRLWDIEMHTQIGTSFIGHADVVYSVAFGSDGRRLVSGSRDGAVRMWNAETHEKIGEALEGHTAAVDCVSESADGRHIVSRDSFGATIIWNRATRAIVWESESSNISNEDVASDGMACKNQATDDEAQKIIRSCGQQVPHLWPTCFPSYSAELHCAEGSVYSDLLGGKTLIADAMLSNSWAYHTDRKVFAVGLESGAVAICKMITK